MIKTNKVYKMVLGAMFLALSLVLPFITGQMQQIGNALCPMHIPVLLCGYICGPFYGAIVGFVAPLLRFMMFGMPPVMPIGISMSFELMTYGLTAGVLYKWLPRKKGYVYVSLIIAMIMGRIVWGVVRVILLGLGKAEFGWMAFLTGAVLNAIPGIIIQLVLIPILVNVLNNSAQEI